MIKKLKKVTGSILVPILSKYYPYKFNSFNLSFSRFCNASCRMCIKTHYDERSKLMYLDDRTLEAALAQFKSMGVRDISIFAMGEPLAHPRFNEFVSRIINAGFTITFSSNGGLLKEKHFSALAKVKSLGFSIEGYDAETVKHYRGVSFDKLYRGITGLRHAIGSKKMILRTTLYKNMDEPYLENFIAVWGPLFDEIIWTPAHPPELYFEKAKGIPKSSSSEYFTYIRDQKNRCASGALGVVILPNGDVISCPCDYTTRFTFGNIKQKPLLKILRSDGLIEFTQKAHTNIDNICGDCSAYFSIVKEDKSIFDERVKFANKRLAKLKQSN